MPSGLTAGVKVGDGDAVLKAVAALAGVGATSGGLANVTVGVGCAGMGVEASAGADEGGKRGEVMRQITKGKVQDQQTDCPSVSRRSQTDLPQHLSIHFVSASPGVFSYCD